MVSAGPGAGHAPIPLSPEQSAAVLRERCLGFLFGFPSLPIELAGVIWQSNGELPVVVMRRARIVSEPVTDYIRYEHAITPLHLQAGEDVRWLPRRRASDISLPGNDFWLLDGRVVQFHHFTGTGDWAPDGKERTTDPAAAALCHAAFETVWERGIPHEKYTVQVP
ncbi:DUF6879 family protein [Streptomyces albidochromogenes]|uniref:DUF6879 family protein n=1 Tax=Streptomyces albidochromogenes TaxID=329524 RepID=A0ABW6FEU8_9ACTN